MPPARRDVRTRRRPRRGARARPRAGLPSTARRARAAAPSARPDEDDRARPSDLVVGDRPPPAARARADGPLDVDGPPDPGDDRPRGARRRSGRDAARASPQEQVRRRPAEHHEPEALVHPPGDEVLVEHAEVRPAAAGGERVGDRRRRSRAGPGPGPGTPAASRSTTGSSPRRTSSAGRSPPARPSTRIEDRVELVPAEQRERLVLDRAEAVRLDVRTPRRGRSRSPRAASSAAGPAIRWTRSTVTSGLAGRSPSGRSDPGRTGPGRAPSAVPPPWSSNPAPSRRSTRSAGSSNPGIGQTCGIRSSDAKSASVSVRRRSNAVAIRPARRCRRSGSRTARGRSRRRAARRRRARRTSRPSSPCDIASCHASQRLVGRSSCLGASGSGGLRSCRAR